MVIINLVIYVVGQIPLENGENAWADWYYSVVSLIILQFSVNMYLKTIQLHFVITKLIISLKLHIKSYKM